MCMCFIDYMYTSRVCIIFIACIHHRKLSIKHDFLNDRFYRNQINVGLHYITKSSSNVSYGLRSTFCHAVILDYLQT